MTEENGCPLFSEDFCGYCHPSVFCNIQMVAGSSSATQWHCATHNFLLSPSLRVGKLTEKSFDDVSLCTTNKNKILTG